MAALLWRTYMREDVRSYVGRISVPTLVAARPTDRMVPFEASAALAEAIDLRTTLVPARDVVRNRGMELFCAGTHPFAKWSAQKLTDAPRYAELIDPCDIAKELTRQTIVNAK